MRPPCSPARSPDDAASPPRLLALVGLGSFLLLGLAEARPLPSRELDRRAAALRGLIGPLQAAVGLPGVTDDEPDQRAPDGGTPSGLPGLRRAAPSTAATGLAGAVSAPRVTPPRYRHAPQQGPPAPAPGC